MMKSVLQVVADGSSSPQGLLRALTLCSLLFACGEKDDSPEQQLRAMFQQAAAAAEARDIGELRALVADEYNDDQGRDKRRIEGLLRLYLLGHQNIHVFTQIKSLDFPEPFRAQAVVLVATAAKPIGDVAELRRLRAELHRFEMEVVRPGRGAWKVTRVAWRRANIIDFL